MIVHPDPLQQYAAAALLEENPTDQVMQDIDESTQDLDCSADDVDAISRNVEVVGQGVESLESYVRTFMAVAPEGEWNRRVARQYQLGFDAVLAANGLSIESSEYSHSFEASGATETHDENRAGTLKKSKEFLKRLWDTFVNMLKSWMSKIGAYFDTVERQANNIKKLGSNLRARANQATGAIKHDEESLGKPAYSAYLFKAGSVGTPKSAVDNVGHDGLALSKAWIEFYVDEANAMSTHATGGGHNDEDLMTRTITDFNKYAGEWFGGKLLVVGDKGGEAATVGGVQLKFEASKHEHTAELKVLTLDEIKTLGDGIENMGRELWYMAIDLKKAVTGLQRIQSKLKIDDIDKFSPSLVAKMVGKVVEGPRACAALMVSVARQAHAHGEASLSKHR